MKEEELFKILFEQDELTWRSMILELVRTEQMDPWDVDLSLLAKRFLDMVKQLKKMDFRISGKIILAAAILLRLKSNKLLTHDMEEFNRLVALSQSEEEEFFEEIEEDYLSKDHPKYSQDDFQLIPRTPQPRKRKVSIYDLIDALQKALDVNKRRKGRQATQRPDIKAPEKTKDISLIIDEIYEQIVEYFMSQQQHSLKFTHFVPNDTKEEKIYVFLPLLYLDNQRKINLKQEHHLGDIDITIHKPSETEESTANKEEEAST